MQVRSSHWISVATVLAVGATLAPTVAAPVRRKAAAPAAKKPVARPAEKADYVRDIQPVMQKYCGSCHGEKVQTAGVNFAEYKDEASVLKAHTTWERVSQMVATHQMPPKNMPQPTAAERALLTTWIDTRLSTADCKIKDPGRVTLRRLNRAEYNNTVHDLLGINFKPAEDFPNDDVGYGFDNIGDVLSLSPLLMEKYLNAAERITDEAIWSPKPPHVERIPVSTLAGGATVKAYKNIGILFSNSAEVRFGVPFPQDGDYVIRIKAFGKQSGNEAPKMVLRWLSGQGQNIQKQEAQNWDVDATEARPETYEFRLNHKAGRSRAELAFTNGFPDQRMLVVQDIEITGPLNFRPADMPEGTKRLFTPRPAGISDRDYARLILSVFARKAYRRPVQPAEVDRLLRYVDMAKKDGQPFERGIQLAVQAVLVSPHFLFHVELDPPSMKPGTAHALNDFELASRLSYFLWSTMPDDALFEKAANGELRKPEVLEAETRRMLKDPRAHALTENFADQWLQLRILKNVNPNPEQFPGWSDKLRNAMLKESETFFQYVMDEDRPILDFINSDYIFVDGRMARHYGMKDIIGNDFRKVQLTGEYAEERGGILGQASILTITSNPTRTSPVKRGKWVLEQILGTPPPPPPPNVPPLDGQAMLKGTLRQRMEQHRANPACATCHQKMDSLGFGLENYDAVGQWRTKDGNDAVDSSGTLPGNVSFNGPAGLKKILMTHKDEFVEAFTRNLMTYALGRGLEYYDKCAVKEIAGDLPRKDYKFSAVVADIVKSAPFRERKVETVAER